MFYWDTMGYQMIISKSFEFILVKLFLFTGFSYQFLWALNSLIWTQDVNNFSKAIKWSFYFDGAVMNIFGKYCKVALLFCMKLEGYSYISQSWSLQVKVKVNAGCLSCKVSLPCGELHKETHLGSPVYSLWNLCSVFSFY